MWWTASICMVLSSASVLAPCSVFSAAVQETGDKAPRLGLQPDGVALTADGHHLRAARGKAAARLGVDGRRDFAARGHRQTAPSLLRIRLGGGGHERLRVGVLGAKIHV